MDEFPQRVPIENTMSETSVIQIGINDINSNDIDEEEFDDFTSADASSHAESVLADNPFLTEDFTQNEELIVPGSFPKDDALVNAQNSKSVTPDFFDFDVEPENVIPRDSNVIDKSSSNYDNKNSDFGIESSPGDFRSMDQTPFSMSSDQPTLYPIVTLSAFVIGDDDDDENLSRDEIKVNLFQNIDIDRDYSEVEIEEPFQIREEKKDGLISDMDSILLEITASESIIQEKDGEDLDVLDYVHEDLNDANLVSNTKDVYDNTNERDEEMFPTIFENAVTSPPGDTVVLPDVILHQGVDNNSTTSLFPNESTTVDLPYTVDDTMLSLFGSKNEAFSVISNEDKYNDNANLSIEIDAAEQEQPVEEANELLNVENDYDHTVHTSVILNEEKNDDVLNSNVILELQESTECIGVGEIQESNGDYGDTVFIENGTDKNGCISNTITNDIIEDRILSDTNIKDVEIVVADDGLEEIKRSNKEENIEESGDRNEVIRINDVRVATEETVIRNNGEISDIISKEEDQGAEENDVLVKRELEKLLKLQDVVIVVEEEYEGVLLEVRDKLEENTEGERDFTAAKEGKETDASLPNEFAKSYSVDDTMLSLFGLKNEDFSVISNEDIYNDDANPLTEIDAVEQFEEANTTIKIEERIDSTSKLSEKISEEVMEKDIVVREGVKAEGIHCEEGMDDVIKQEEGGMDGVIKQEEGDCIVQKETSRDLQQEEERLEESRADGEIKEEEEEVIDLKDQQIVDDDDDDWGDFNDSSSSQKELVLPIVLELAVALVPGNLHEQILKDELIDAKVQISDTCDDNKLDDKEILLVSNEEEASTSTMNVLSNNNSNDDTVMKNSSGIDSSPHMDDEEDKDDEWDDFEGAVGSPSPVVQTFAAIPAVQKDTQTKSTAALGLDLQSSIAQEEGEALHLLLDRYWDKRIKDQYITFREKSNSIFGSNLVNVKDIHDLKECSSRSSSSERLPYTQLKSPLVMASLCSSPWAKGEVLEAIKSTVPTDAVTLEPRHSGYWLESVDVKSPLKASSTSAGVKQGVSTPGPKSPPFSPPSSPGGGSPKRFFPEDTSGPLDKKNQAPLPVKDSKTVHSELRKSVNGRQEERVVHPITVKNPNFQPSNGQIHSNKNEKNLNSSSTFPSSSGSLSPSPSSSSVLTDIADNNKKINDKDIIEDKNNVNNTLSDLDFGFLSTPVIDKNDDNDAYNDFDDLFNSIADSNTDGGNVKVIFDGDEIIGLSYEGKKFLKSLPDYSYLIS